ncbi:hypothetical protein [Bacillus sp. MRMR6]|nr:hypothetical protein [Bacillus sp. MRMR6]
MLINEIDYIFNLWKTINQCFWNKTIFLPHIFKQLGVSHTET